MELSDTGFFLSGRMAIVKLEGSAELLETQRFRFSVTNLASRPGGKSALPVPPPPLAEFEGASVAFPAVGGGVMGAVSAWAVVTCACGGWPIPGSALEGFSCGVSSSAFTRSSLEVPNDIAPAKFGVGAEG